MYIDYINEAFKNLDLLTEDMFDTSPSGINNLSRFMDEDDDIEEVRVIDADASDEDDIQDSYIGKVIINCNVCHSHVFEDKDEIVLADDGFANMDVACPYCGETEGFTIVGEIAEFNKNSDNAPQVDSNNEETKEISEIETEVIEESLTETKRNFKPHTIRLLKLIGSDLVDGLDEELSDKTKLSPSETYIAGDDHDYLVRTKLDSGEMAGHIVYKAFKNRVHAGTIEFENDPKKPHDAEAIERWKKKDFSESLQEDFKEVSITTDDQHMEMTSDESGKVSITTEPIKSTEGDTIVPVSDETEASIITNNQENDTEVPSEDTIETPEVETEAPADEATTTDSGTEEDIELEDIDETSVDELGESYLKRVYENVESFKTSNVFSTDTGLIIEGVIGFTSGSKKTTKFIFESADMNENGQVRFIGTNKHLTESCNAYSLIGRVSDKKLVVESLKYNYKTPDSNSVRGVVRKK